MIQKIKQSTSIFQNKYLIVERSIYSDKNVFAKMLYDNQNISNLEYEVGIPLFHRHQRGLILTEQGELLYKKTHGIIDIIKDAEFDLIDSKEKPSGDLSITTTIGLGTNWLTPRLKEFT